VALKPNASLGLQLLRDRSEACGHGQGQPAARNQRRVGRTVRLQSDELQIRLISH
jgi:hypothetical protein